jgi:8-oxo-dGTP diphosphatase
LCKRKDGILKGADDAKEAKWFSLDDLPKLAFDHDTIISDVREAINAGQ